MKTRWTEESLPDHILAAATRAGNEWAWPLDRVPEAIAAAADLGFATLGGQVQFRVPGGTCELYWRNADSSDRLPDEPWGEFVRRSAAEVFAGVIRLPPEAAMIDEGLGWEYLSRLHYRGDDLRKYLCFVLCFVTEAEYLRLAVPNGQPAT